MKKVLIIAASVLLLVGGGFAWSSKDDICLDCMIEGVNGDVNIDGDGVTCSFRIENPSNGNATSDLVLVLDPTSKYVHKTLPFNTMAANYMSSSVSYANTASRTLVSTVGAAGYQINSTKRARVSYSVSHSTVLSLIQLNAVAKTFLEISPTGASGTWIPICSTGKSKSVSVAVALTESEDLNLSGEVPAGWYVRLRSANTGGGSTTYLSGQEVTY